MELLELDPSTQSTLIYIRGNVLRKIINHSNCQLCTDVLILNVKDTSTSSFLLQMDFTGNSLLEPTTQMMTFFHILISVYTHHKLLIPALSTNQNVLKKLLLLSIKALKAKDYSIPFCSEHCDCYTQLMIQSTMKTFLKAYIHEMNENFVTKSSSGQKPKNRKLAILTNGKD